MQNSIVQLVEAIFQMLLSLRMNQQGLTQEGLGVGGSGLTSELIKRMLMSPESQKAYKKLTGKDNGMNLMPDTQKGVSLSESDYRGWNKEVDKKLTASLKELGLDDAAIAQFKTKTKDIALQMETLAMRYPDPVERNMAVSDFIDKEVNGVRKEVEQLRQRGMTTEQITETVQMGDRDRRLSSPIGGGMMEKQAMYNGVGLAQGVSVWMPDNVITRLQQQPKALEEEHAVQLEAKSQLSQAANEARMVKDLREGMSRGTVTADELVRRSTQLYDMGDKSLLVQLGLEQHYQDYKVAKVLNNSSKMWQIYSEMGKQATEYLKKVQGQGMEVIGQQMTVQQTHSMSMGMHF
ncbi:MAG: hypothetical protein ACI3ZY_00085 [Parabacteroides sp.]